MFDQPAFGQRLRELRLAHGLSQAQLAGDEVSTGYLSRLESGVRRPTPRVVELFAARLGIPALDFDPLTAGGPVTGQLLAPAQILATVVSGTDDELTDTLADALRDGDKWDLALRWQGLWLLACAQSRQGRHDEARAILTELVELSDALGNPALRIRSRVQLSRAARGQGDNVTARRHAADAYQIAPDVSVSDRAAVLHALTSAEAELSMLVDARAHADELCALTEPVGGQQFVKAQWASATVRIRQGDYADALSFMEPALVATECRQDPTMWIRLRLAAASLYLQMTPLPLTDQAQALLDEVAPAVQMLGTKLHQTQLLTLRAHLAFEQGRLDEARTICAQVEDEAPLSFRDRLRFQALCGRLRIVDGDREGGVQRLQDLARRSQEAHHTELAAEIWRMLAETLLEDAPGSAKPRFPSTRNTARSRPRGRGR